MKRILEKVKDVVDARPYKSLRDFTSDPMQTVSIYRFTDFTSVLMAKWLDKIASVQAGSGAAYALAGYRGVGKSHFSDALGAIVSHPELRSRITDPHVAASAERLRRSRYPIAYVRRGTNETLIGEIKDAIAKTFEIDVSSLNDSISDLLNFAAQKAGELPFLLFVDTAFERASRVARDDGVLLGEIAALAKNLNVFVAVALDDDIAGADGINAAIAGNFTIDYLDQEHLYRIVDSHIFPKYRQMQPLLHEIYTNFREVLPHFRWSEQRFVSLYPLHPILLEIAPFVRLYEPEFALLGFASEAGAKILGRPANSLIALDEVFDNVEQSFRKIQELNEAFVGYDKISAAINTQVHVLQRLQAKLILKALFLLSIEGGGTTAGEISAAMLISDENEPLRAVKMVEELLEKFVSILPDCIQRIAETGREIRYNFKISSQDNLNIALTEAVKSVPHDVVTKILRRTAWERFADWAISDDTDLLQGERTEHQTAWRGTARRGQVVWNLDNKSVAAENSFTNSEFLDWQVTLNQSPENFNAAESGETIRVLWQPALLKNDETEAILRYWVLLTNTNLREEYGEQMRAAGHAQMMTIEKIWNRIFLEDAKLIISGLDYNFSESAQRALTLQELFSKILEPFFDARFPDHPHFTETIGIDEVSQLINDFFSGARLNLAETQHLAKTFALPLGLARQNENNFVLESQENLNKLPLVREILSEVEQNSAEMTSLQTIYKKLKQPPNGLAREAQQLILTALVANRQIEFVTSEGDRISRRSLDLKVIWDDIAGIAKPSGIVYSNERLIEWAKILTGANFPNSIGTTEEQIKAKDILNNWLADWKGTQILERFNLLPDDILNTKIWRLSSQAEKTFGAVIEAVETVSDDSISLEDALHRIADAFSDSQNEFLARTKDLVVLEDFTVGAAIREKIWSYLAVCEPTQDEKLEFSREKLFRLIDESSQNPNVTLNREMENLWKTFHEQFSDYFADRHDALMKSEHLQEKLGMILRGDHWWEFENLSALPIFRQSYWNDAQEIRSQIAGLTCRFDVREMLKTHPFCACSFSLAKIREWEKLPAALEEVVYFGRKSFRENLKVSKRILIPLIESLSVKFRDNEFSMAALHLSELLKRDFAEIPLLSGNELIVLQKVFADLPAPSLREIEFANESLLQKI
jgi:hypothetical protein